MLVDYYRPNVNSVSLGIVISGESFVFFYVY